VAQVVDHLPGTVRLWVQTPVPPKNQKTKKKKKKGNTKQNKNRSKRTDKTDEWRVLKKESKYSFRSLLFPTIYPETKMNYETV
jgi:hypothetical protein